MKISVIIPIFDVTESLLRASLDSLAQQSLRADEFEILLVDDCSTDARTKEVIAAFASKMQNARVIRHDENRGLNETRRTGVREATGDYFLFLDGDDILTRDAIEILRMEAHKTNADLVTAQSVRWHNNKKRYTPIQISSRALARNFETRIHNVLAGKHTFTMCGRLFRKSVLTDEVFDVPPRLYHEDLATFTRALYNVKVSAHVKHFIYYYTVNDDSITSEITLKHVQDMFWSLYDWKLQSEKHGVIDAAAEAIPQGLERLMNICAERCIESKSINTERKVEILSTIKQLCDEFPLKQENPKLEPFTTLQSLDLQTLRSSSQEAVAELEQSKVKRKGSPVKERNDPFTLGMQPTEMAQHLKGKIVFIGQVNYQLRSAASFAKDLTALGYDCVILDNSGFASDGLRTLPPEEDGIFGLSQRIKIEKPPYEADFLSTALLVIVFNDFNYDFREALEYRQRLGLPSVCAVEGINDFLRLDFTKYRLLPYRRCEFVFLAGDNDRQFFSDRKTFVTGLPIIEALSQKTPRFPQKPLAILNVNFTYGVLEKARDQFVSSALRAFEKANFECAITKHPAEKGDFSRLPVSERSQYELIDLGTVFVSRFATGILEALASGKPAIYFNPHQEKVEKYKSPMGAFTCAKTEEELTEALGATLQDIANGVDFRKRAEPFLRHHANYAPQETTTASRFTEAVANILEKEEFCKNNTPDIFFESLDKKSSLSDTTMACIFGSFTEDHGALLDEAKMVSLLENNDKRQKVMLYCGPPSCIDTWSYLGKGWEVRASTSPQADSGNPDLLNVSLTRRGERLISDVLNNGGKPDIVLVSCENSARADEENVFDSVARQLLEKEYSLYLSEWRNTHTVGKPAWVRLRRFTPGLESTCDHGRLIAFAKDPGEEALRRAAQASIKFGKSTVAA